MDIAQLASELNSNAIKDLNRYHILSVFYQNEWYITEQDIDSVQFSEYLTNNTEGFIKATTERKWLFFTDTFYSVSREAHIEWETLVTNVDATEEAIEKALGSEQSNSKELIEEVIKKDWPSVAFFVIARDIAQGGFEISDVGIFHTAMRIHETYSRRSRKLVSSSKFRGRYDMVRYYDEHEDNFWCDFLILDLITNGQLDFNFIDKSDMYNEYYLEETSYSYENEESIVGTEETQEKDNLYFDSPDEEIETYDESTPVDVSNMSSTSSIDIPISSSSYDSGSSYDSDSSW